ncbi:MAG: hypothetical protein OHK0056_12540 [Bacteriovoracaceae bacterium]
MSKRAIAYGLILATLVSTQSCGGRNEGLYPHTGSQVLEAGVSTTVESKGEIELGRSYFISTNGLRIRTSPEISNNIAGTLSRNDEVKVVDLLLDQDTVFVKIEVIRSELSIAPADAYFVSFKYLMKEKFSYKQFTGKYFVIQNIATERLRVYERVCADNSCPHKMIMEAEIAVGEDKDETRTWLGSYRLTHWVKFYQDGAGTYPSWYHPDYPMPPGPDKGVLSWFKKKYMPEVDGKPKGAMRGAFGWYTGFLAPNHNAQWTHGTIGWGVNKTSYIERTKKLMANLVSDPRSHGCSRTDNESIAFLREMLPAGTPFLKVYAIEALKNPVQPAEQRTWDYVLTKHDSRKVDGFTSDRVKVMEKGVASEDILEQGTYVVDTQPDVVEFDKKAGRLGRKLGAKGNVYGVDLENMKGVFYIDTGLFEGYAHPVDKRITVGGYQDEVLPEFVNNDLLKL